MNYGYVKIKTLLNEKGLTAQEKREIQKKCAILSTLKNGKASERNRYIFELLTIVMNFLIENISPTIKFVGIKYDKNDKVNLIDFYSKVGEENDN